MKFIALILFLLLQILGYAQYDSLRFKMLESGIIHKLDINGIYFTRDGKTWFGTSEGLASYDGNDFKVYPADARSDEDINPQRITAFAEDKDGLIWTFSNNHILSKFNPKTSRYEKVNFLKEFSSLEHKLSLSVLHFDSENKLWLGAEDVGFFIYDPATNKTAHYNLDQSKPRIWENRYGNWVRYFLQDPSDKNIMWIAGYGAGILSFNKQSGKISKNFRAAHTNDSLWRNCYVTQMTMKGKIIWFGTWGTGIGEYNTETGMYKMYPKNIGFYSERVGNEIFVHGHIVIRLLPKSENEYIVALADSLPAVFNTTTKKFSYLKDAQLARTIDRVLNIGTGNIDKNTWFLKGGRLYFASPQYNLFKQLHFNSKKAPRYHSEIGDIIWNDKSKSYYVAANFSEGVHVLDQKFSDKEIISMPPYNGNGIVNASSAWRIRFDGTGRLWAMGHIFCVYDSMTKSMIPAEKKYPAIKALRQPFRNFTTDATGNLILLSEGRELVFLNAVTFTLQSVLLPQVKSEKKFDFRISSILIDTLRNLIYACDGQAIFQYNIKKKAFKTIEFKARVANGLPASNVSGYALDFDGNLWVGSQGIHIFEPRNLTLIKRITAKENLTDNININLLQGPPGYMIFFTPKGGNLYSLHDSTFVHFDLNNGMASENLSGFFYANNHIFLNIGLYTNLNQYANVASLLSLKKQMVPYVAGIRIQNKKIEMDTIPEFLSRLRLLHDQSSLTFTFSSIEFEFPERVEYSYILHGLEKDWTNTDYMNRTVTYTNLKHGEYTFKVRARMLGGKWLEGKPLYVSIIPAFWQTTWFILLCAFLTALVIYYMVRQRMNALKKKERLRTLNEKKLMELEAQALRAQMNPHFIFNCLNSIKALILKNETDIAANYLTTFSKLIRTLFHHSDKREVSLFEEIETCKLYTQLEALRFKDKVSFNFQVDEKLDLKDIKVPALILQPFIENAIWHGLVPKNEGGHVSISIEQNEKGIQCIVDDDGIGRELSQQYKGDYNNSHESKGISLTESRLNIDKILNDSEEEINIMDKKDSAGNATGTRAILTFKFSKE